VTIPSAQRESFRERFVRLRKARASVLCIGLDPDLDLLPAGYDRSDPVRAIADFLSDVIAATADLAIAYKPNLAFYECLGPQGMDLFETVLRLIREKAPDALIIADAKRGDIGNTAAQYARAFFESYACDAITLSPYMGMDTFEPFLKYRDRAVIALCHTSNPGAPEFQEYGQPPLYLRVARAVEERNRKTDNLWLVVGATRDSASIEKIRKEAPGVPFLMPGVGAQGGDLDVALRAAGRDVLINVGRAVLYGASHRDALVPAARAEAERMLAIIRKYL
jgi:orotidine-5'-phosphate decarboxylase